MNSNHKKIQAILSGQEKLVLPIQNEGGEVIGRLAPMTASIVNDPEMIDCLTKWRNLARNSFFTQFQATHERTRNWLVSRVVLDFTRLLFLIYSPKKVIGHLGFRNLQQTSAELDNLIRGEIGGDPRLVFFAEKTLVDWMFCELGLKKITADVFSANVRVISLHEEIGFKVEGRVPLTKTETQNEVHYSLGNLGEESAQGIYVTRMSLEARQGS